MAASPATRHLVATLAATTRHHPNDDVTDLRRDLAAQQIEDYVRRVVDNAPPLTAEQRDRLALILRGPGE